jgi:hypothetical protein
MLQRRIPTPELPVPLSLQAYTTSNVTGLEFTVSFFNTFKPNPACKNIRTFFSE